jgi:hypothetical protein
LIKKQKARYCGLLDWCDCIATRQIMPQELLLGGFFHFLSFFLCHFSSPTHVEFKITLEEGTSLTKAGF